MRNLREVLKLIKFSYPRDEFTEENIRAYMAMLRDLDPQLLELAALQLLRESKWLPTIAEITGRVVDLALQQSGHLSGMAAYEVAINGGRLREDHPDILRAVEMSCGDTYNMRHSSNPAADRARFLEAYAEITRKKRNEIITAPAVKAFLKAGSNGHVQLTEGDHVSDNFAD